MNHFYIIHIVLSSDCLTIIVQFPIAACVCLCSREYFVAEQRIVARFEKQVVRRFMASPAPWLRLGPLEDQRKTAIEQGISPEEVQTREISFFVVVIWWPLGFYHHHHPLYFLSELHVHLIVPIPCGSLCDHCCGVFSSIHFIVATTSRDVTKLMGNQVTTPTIGVCLVIPRQQRHPFANHSCNQHLTHSSPNSQLLLYCIIYAYNVIPRTHSTWPSIDYIHHCTRGRLNFAEMRIYDQTMPSIHSIRQHLLLIAVAFLF